VKKLAGTGKNFIDLLWKGVLIAEHKSAGKDLGKAYSQAMSYVQDLINEGRRLDAPRYIIVSDFKRIALHDLDKDTVLEIELRDLYRHIEAFGFIANIQQVEIKPQDPVNIAAAEKMADLHDALLEGRYPAEHLDKLLTRLLFCLFAEDTRIFEANHFTHFILNETRDDGSDLGAQLTQLFSVLDTEVDQRQTALSAHLLSFPYVNGKLFTEQLPPAGTNRKMRDMLLKATELDWSRISPAIFGSMFQGVMEPTERRQVGAHYTSETDILKVINPLFMDALRAEFSALLPLKDKKERLKRLRAFHDKIASLNFLDPACGCGNFLIIAYRELRALETEVIQQELAYTQQTDQIITDIALLTRVRVSQFHGIEIGHFPAEIARVAMWLIDHQANLHLSQEIGRYFLRLPLTAPANIVTANALEIDWQTVIAPAACSYIFGNPPFIGKTYQTEEQRRNFDHVFSGVDKRGVLDFVACWHLLAAKYAKGYPISSAFVSTNSLCQGEQASVLWPLLKSLGVKIHFAHRTFPWQSEARGKAHVHCIIVGFGAFEPKARQLFDYDNGTVTVTTPTNISPYLIEGGDLAVTPRTRSINAPSEMSNGSKPVDGGHLIFSDEELADFLQKEPAAQPYMRKFLGSEEFLNGGLRWCLWLTDITPATIRTMPEVLKRVEGVKQMRLNSKDAQTRKNASRPSLFAYIRQPQTQYLAIPEVSSENRSYIPIAFLEPTVICSNKIQYVPNASPYSFGILTSAAHMAWMRTVGGRLKSDYSYSAKLVYNNFPWPSPTDSQKLAVEKAAQAVLTARALFPDSTLADLYDPLSMPPALAKAHDALDRAVDLCYRPKRFPSDRERVEHLFHLYEQLTTPLVKNSKQKTPRKQVLRKNEEVN